MRIAICISLLASCAPPPVGNWSAEGFHRSDPAPYTLEASSEGVVEGWRVDNWIFPEKGPATPHSGPSNWSTYRYDVDGDDEAEFEFRYPTSDVLLRHGRTGAMMSIALVPVEPRRRERTVDVLLRNWIRNAAGSRYAVRVDRRAATVSEERWTTRTIAMNPARVGGYNAAAATFEVADVDRLRFESQRADLIGRAVLMATPFRKPTPDYSREPELRFALLIVLLSHPNDFDALLPDFERFVAAIGLPAPEEGGTATEGVLPTVVEPAGEPAPEPIEEAPVDEETETLEETAPE